MRVRDHVTRNIYMFFFIVLLFCVFVVVILNTWHNYVGIWGIRSKIIHHIGWVNHFFLLFSSSFSFFVLCWCMRYCGLCFVKINVVVLIPGIILQEYGAISKHQKSSYSPHRKCTGGLMFSHSFLLFFCFLLSCVGEGYKSQPPSFSFSTVCLWAYE